MLLEGDNAGRLISLDIVSEYGFCLTDIFEILLINPLITRHSLDHRFGRIVLALFPTKADPSSALQVISGGKTFGYMQFEGEMRGKVKPATPICDLGAVGVRAR